MLLQHDNHTQGNISLARLQGPTPEEAEGVGEGQLISDLFDISMHCPLEKKKHGVRYKDDKKVRPSKWRNGPRVPQDFQSWLQLTKLRYIRIKIVAH